jgi:hypothetical protein
LRHSNAFNLPKIHDLLQHRHDRYKFFDQRYCSRTELRKTDLVSNLAPADVTVPVRAVDFGLLGIELETEVRNIIAWRNFTTHAGHARLTRDLSYRLADSQAHITFER